MVLGWRREYIYRKDFTNWIVHWRINKTLAGLLNQTMKFDERELFKVLEEITRKKHGWLRFISYELDKSTSNLRLYQIYSFAQHDILTHPKIDETQNHVAKTEQSYPCDTRRQDYG